MKRLSDLIGCNLKIVQTNVWQREYKFIAENDLIGEMKYPRLFSDTVVCQIEKEVWEFSRPNIFSDKILIRKQGYELPIATLESNFFATKAEVKLPRGRKVLIKTGFLKKQVEIYLNENDLLAKLYNKFSFKGSSDIMIEKRSEVLDENPWIILLAFYYAQLRRKNSGVAF